MIVYIHPTCTTCKKALKWFELNGVKFEQRDIRENPPTAKDLLSIKKNQNLEWKKVANTSGELYRSLGLKDKLSSMSDEEAASLLSSNGMLIKRPLVLNDGEATFGFKEEVYEEKWKR
ncbi:arsenate reductase family protein [uncultured Granulicatella sp.]|uniref:arsenate reductase family protein n=1 Tax=uncultured Granulicatella sp. TaxID=316089 RepID=UPI002610DCAF|nr:arsenate reductase family protein [uncultured Granulicatella sp.]